MKRIRGSFGRVVGYAIDSHAAPFRFGPERRLELLAAARTFALARSGKPGPPMPKRKEELPSTIERSSGKVQRTYEKTLDSAHEQYDSEEQAHRTAWSAVKHVAEKKGDRWTLKDEPGPSDPQAKQSGAAARERPRKTAGGIDVEASTRDELYERAKELRIEGRSKMTKRELAEAVRRKI
jgi:cation transport regulator ChaB